MLKQIYHQEKWVRSYALMMSLCTLTALPVLARADATGDALLQKCLDAEKNAQTLQCDFTIQQNGASGKGTLQLKKPNIAHIAITPPGAESIVLHSNGKTFTILHTAENAYETQSADMTGGNVVARASSPEATVFFNPDMMNRLISSGTGVKVGESATIGGVACKTLLVTGTGKNVIKFYIGPDNLLRGYSQIFNNGSQQQTLDTRLLNVRVNIPLPAATLAWNVPKGAKTAKEYAAQQNTPASGTAPSSGLIPTGKTAPIFELQQLGGGKVSLASVLKANKVTLLNYWAHW